ncbi:MAG: ABC transporter ATP-binding protein [Burkholderiaceae bacterium]|nr:ABC transporter ATP-binding protein [Burkholderiaceae bacterium]
MTTMLQITGLSRSFGGIRAVDNVNFETKKGAITGIIGPNGAGKTTLFNVISGTLKAGAGEVSLDGKRITQMSAAAVARQGLVRTFQMTTVFPGCSVYQNLYRAALFRTFPTPASLLNPMRVFSGRKAAAAAAHHALELIDMADLSDSDAGSLAYGLQKTLGVGMALATQPRMLLMDEPAAGLNPSEKETMSALIAKIHASGVDIVLVEHDMKMVMKLCEQIIVLVNGTQLAAGPAADIRNNPAVIDAYLGADLDHA